MYVCCTHVHDVRVLRVCQFSASELICLQRCDRTEILVNFGSNCVFVVILEWCVVKLMCLIIYLLVATAVATAVTARRAYITMALHTIAVILLISKINKSPNPVITTEKRNEARTSTRDHRQSPHFEQDRPICCAKVNKMG